MHCDCVGVLKSNFTNILLLRSGFLFTSLLYFYAFIFPYCGVLHEYLAVLQLRKKMNSDSLGRVWTQSEPLASFALQTGSSVQHLALQTGFSVQRLALQTGSSVQYLALRTGFSVQHLALQTGFSVQYLALQTSFSVLCLALQTGFSVQYLALQTGFSVQHLALQTGFSVQYLALQTSFSVLCLALQTGFSVQYLALQTGFSVQYLALQTDFSVSCLADRLLYSVAISQVPSLLGLVPRSKLCCTCCGPVKYCGTDVPQLDWVEKTATNFSWYITKQHLVWAWECRNIYLLMLWWGFNAMRQWEGDEQMGGSMEEEEEGCGCGGWMQRNRFVEINQRRAMRNRAAFQRQGHTADNGTSTTPGLSPKPCKTLPNWDPDTLSNWDPDTPRQMHWTALGKQLNQTLTPRFEDGFHNTTSCFIWYSEPVNSLHQDTFRIVL